MKIKRVRSIRSLLNQLTQVATPADHSDYVFRGHSNSDWRIQSTYGRYTTSSLYEFRELEFKQIIARFEDNLARLGDRHMQGMSLRGKLEFARHAGVPSPLIDFTRSPLVALWFAFNGIRGSANKKSSVAVYSLNLMHLTIAYSNFCKSLGMEEYFRSRFDSKPIDLFRWEREEFFDEEYPLNVIKFLPLAASWNTKMQRQMGCFIYDNLIYDKLGVADFEALVCEHEAFRSVSVNNPILTKYVIPCDLARDAFDYLDLHGINGVHLFNDHAGAVADVYNGFNYNTRVQSWDLSSQR